LAAVHLRRAAVHAKLPVSDSEEDIAKRNELWTRFDDDNSGLLSLAKIDKGVKEVLEIDVSALQNTVKVQSPDVKLLAEH
jgi:hypothetical protein